MSLISLFSRKNKDERTDKSEDYTVSHSKTTDIILRIVSVLAAVLIWIYAVSTDGSLKTSTYEFMTSDIMFIGEEDWESAGYRPTVDDLAISVSVQGRRLDINSFEKSKASLYVYLVGEDDSSIYKVNVRLPNGLTLTSVTPEYVAVRRTALSTPTDWVR